MPGVTTAYQSGVHGSRPAASAGCILYSCTTHGLVYRSDGTNWTTWLTLPSGVSSATPALTFGTAAAAGAASTYVATDATLPIFDATVPSTQAFSDAAAAGSAGVAARRDHKHAMPSGAWASWTPALTASSVNPTMGSGSTVSGRYIQLGKLVCGYGNITFGSSGAAAGTGIYQVNFPVAPATSPPQEVIGSAMAYDASAGIFLFLAAYVSSSTIMSFALNNDASISAGNGKPMVWANNDQLRFHFMYEAA